MKISDSESVKEKTKIYKETGKKKTKKKTSKQKKTKPKQLQHLNNAIFTP